MVASQTSERRFMTDHLVHTQFDKPSDKLTEAVKFVIHKKLLFWIETMSILGRAYEVSLILKKVLAWKVCLQVISLWCTWCWLASPSTLIMSWHCLSMMPSGLFLHSSFQFHNLPLMCTSPHFPLYLSNPMLPENSAHGFTILLWSLKGNLVNGQWQSSLRSTTNLMCTISLSHQIKAHFYPDHTALCISETGHCISGPFEIPDGNDACLSPSGRHTLFKTDSYAVVWDIEMSEEQFQIRGFDFAFVHHDGTIVSVNQEESLDNSRQKGTNGILIQFWDAPFYTQLVFKMWFDFCQDQSSTLGPRYVTTYFYYFCT